jgi:hypothetical protein
MFDVQLFSLESGTWVTHSRVSSFVGAHVLARSFETDGTVVRVVEATEEAAA